MRNFFRAGFFSEKNMRNFFRGKFEGLSPGIALYIL